MVKIGTNYEFPGFSNPNIEAVCIKMSPYLGYLTVMKRKKPMLKKALSGILVTLTLLTFTGPTHADGTTDEMFTENFPPDPNLINLRAYPGGETSGWASRLFGDKLDANRRVTSVVSCTSLADSKCADANYFNAIAILPFCSDAQVIDCIVGVTAQDANGLELPVSSPIKFMGSRAQDFVGDPKAFLPSGGFTSVVDIPGAPHQFGTLYMPVVKYMSILNEKYTPQSKFQFGHFEVGFYAVRLIKGSFEIPQYSTEYPIQVNNPDVMAIHINNGQCAQTDGITCAYAGPIPTSIKFGIRLHLSSKLTGWYSGRFSNPDLNISSDGNTGYYFEIKANAVQVPIVAHQYPINSLPQDLKDFYTSPNFYSESGNNSKTDGFHNGINGNQNQILDRFTKLMQLIGDKSDASPTLWQFSDMANIPFDVGCYTSNDQVLGVVSTNSILYLDGPPAWNSNTKTLEYRVASPHYSKDGSVFKGTYDLALRSSTARCLYGFSNAPVTATISVIAADGSQVLATTLLRESNGWLYLQAKGFTFSSPTVLVQLHQEQAPQPTPSPTPTPSSSANNVATNTTNSDQINSNTVLPVKPSASASAKPIAKTTITCIKGKLKKVVTGVKPTCPSGYQKK